MLKWRNLSIDIDTAIDKAQSTSTVLSEIAFAKQQVWAQITNDLGNWQEIQDVLHVDVLWKLNVKFFHPDTTFDNTMMKNYLFSCVE